MNVAILIAGAMFVASAVCFVQAWRYGRRSRRLFREAEKRAASFLTESKAYVDRLDAEGRNHTNGPPPPPGPPPPGLGRTPSSELGWSSFRKDRSTQ